MREKLEVICTEIGRPIENPEREIVPIVDPVPRELPKEQPPVKTPIEPIKVPAGR